MLVLKRKEGQWTEAVSRSGDVLRIRVQGIRSEPGGPPRVSLVFDDPDRNFEIHRPERASKPLTPAGMPAPEAEPFDPFAFRLGDDAPGDQAVS